MREARRGARKGGGRADSESGGGRRAGGERGAAAGRRFGGSFWSRGKCGCRHGRLSRAEWVPARRIAWHKIITYNNRINNPTHDDNSTVLPILPMPSQHPRVQRYADRRFIIDTHLMHSTPLSALLPASQPLTRPSRSSRRPPPRVSARPPSPPRSSRRPRPSASDPTHPPPSPSPPHQTRTSSARARTHTSPPRSHTSAPPP
mmetsp:Transcript_21396/g.52659  ORF Transcript_21396/g.52659 Transcript_21396/m.52659 type:complete len:203 (-) Transcript_21396:94-702(-)